MRQENHRRAPVSAIEGSIRIDLLTPIVAHADHGDRLAADLYREGTIVQQRDPTLTEDSFHQSVIGESADTGSPDAAIVIAEDREGGRRVRQTAQCPRIRSRIRNVNVADE